MTTIYLKCTGANLSARVDGEITAGMRGIGVEISFDEAWQGLTPVLVVSCAEENRRMAIDGAGLSTIPWECCIGGETMKVGLCGLNNDGTVKLPTVWASCGRVRPSPEDVQAEEGGAPPTPDLVEQVIALANQAQAAAHAVTEAAQRGDFNGQPGAIPALSVGTVTELPADVPAAASITGTVQNPVLNLGIPAGKNGKDALPPNIQIGTVNTVSSNTPAAVRRRGTDANPVFDFDIPKGADGQDGSSGVRIDPALSHAGQAADAKATGDAIAKCVPRRGVAVVLGDSAFDGGTEYNFASFLRQKGLYSEVVDHAIGGCRFTYPGMTQYSLVDILQRQDVQADIARADEMWLSIGFNDVFARANGTGVDDETLLNAAAVCIELIRAANPDILVRYIHSGYQSLAETIRYFTVNGFKFNGMTLSASTVYSMCSAMDAMTIALLGAQLNIVTPRTRELIQHAASDGLHPTAEAIKAMYEATIAADWYGVRTTDHVMLVLGGDYTISAMLIAAGYLAKSADVILYDSLAGKFYTGFFEADGNGLSAHVQTGKNGSYYLVTASAVTGIRVELVDDISKLKNEKAAASALADAYSSQKTYKAGNYCIYGNALWRCKVGCAGVTPVNGTNWVQTNLANEMETVYSVPFTRIENDYFSIPDDYRSCIYRVGRELRVNLLVICKAPAAEMVKIASISGDMKYLGIIGNTLSPEWSGAEFTFEGNGIYANFGKASASYRINATILLNG